MKNTLRLAFLITAILSLIGVAARGDTFSYTYTFGGASFSYNPGTTVSGTFDGVLNGPNLITDISDVSVFLNGVSMGPIFAEGYTSISPEVTVHGLAVVSIDGTQNNFVFINSDHAGGDLSYTAFFNSITNADANYIQALSPDTYAIDVGVLGETSAVNSTWSVNLISQSVPDKGATVTLLMLPIAVVASLRRRSAKQSILAA